MERDDKLLPPRMKALYDRIDLSGRDSFALVCAKIDEGAAVHAERLARGDPAAAEFFVLFGSLDKEMWSSSPPLILQDWNGAFGAGCEQTYHHIREYARITHGLHFVVTQPWGNTRFIRLSVHEPSRMWCW